MEGVADLRWQDDEQLHLTLRFVGEVERPVANDLAAALTQIRFDRFDLALDGVGKFEHRRRGALWAGVAPKDRLKALNAKIDRACQAAGLEPERRAYHPHVTLARWSGRPQGIDRYLERNSGLRSDPWQVSEFILLGSHLGRDGAHYEPVDCYPLI